MSGLDLGHLAAKAAQQPVRERTADAVSKISRLLKSKGGFFTSFSNEVLEEISQVVTLNECGENATLLQEGTRARKILIVAYGHLKVTSGTISRVASRRSTTFGRGNDEQNLVGLNPTPGQEEDAHLEFDQAAPALKQSRLSMVRPDTIYAFCERLSDGGSRRGSRGSFVGHSPVASRRGSRTGTYLGDAFAASPRGSPRGSPRASPRASMASLFDPGSGEPGTRQSLLVNRDGLRKETRLSVASLRDQLASGSKAMRFDSNSPKTSRAATPTTLPVVRREVSPAGDHAAGDPMGLKAAGRLQAPAVQVIRSLRESGVSSRAGSAAAELPFGKTFTDFADKVGIADPDEVPPVRKVPSKKRLTLDQSCHLDTDSSADSSAGNDNSPVEVDIYSPRTIGGHRKKTLTTLEFEKQADDIAQSYKRSNEAGPGQVVGVRACLLGRPQEWTVVALEPCGVLELTSGILQEFVSKERALRMQRRQQLLLDLVPALRTLDQDKLERVVECFKESRHGRGAVLCWEGEMRIPNTEGDRFAIIIKGQARALKLTAAGAAEDAEPSNPPTTMKMPKGGIYHRSGSAGGAMRLRDVSTLLPGYLVNSSSQLMGLAEPLTVVADSAEVVTVSATHSDLVRYAPAGTGVLEALKVAAEELASWHDQRTTTLVKSSEAVLPPATPRKQKRKAPPASVRPLPLEILHEDRTELKQKNRLPPGVKQDVAWSSELVPEPPIPLPNQPGKFVRKEDPNQALLAYTQRMSFIGSQVPSLSESVRSWSQEPSPLVDGVSRNVLLDASFYPEDVADLTLNSMDLGFGGSLDQALSAAPPLLAQTVSAQLRERELVNLAGSPAHLQSLELRGSSAVLCAVAPISPICVNSALPPGELRPVTAPDVMLPKLHATQPRRRLLVSTQEEPSGSVASPAMSPQPTDREERPDETLKVPSSAPAVASRDLPVSPLPLDRSERSATPSQAGPARVEVVELPPSPRARARNNTLTSTFQGLMPVATPIALSQRRDAPTSSRGQRPHSEQLAGPPVTRGQLQDFGAALEMVDMLRPGGEPPQGGGEETDAPPTPTASTGADDLAQLSTLIDEGSIWEQLTSHMSEGHESRELALLRHESQISMDVSSWAPSASLQLGGGAGPRQVLPQRPELPRRTPQLPRGARRWRPLVHVGNKTGRKEVNSFAPLHVHSIERFLHRKD